MSTQARIDRFKEKVGSLLNTERDPRAKLSGLLGNNSSLSKLSGLLDDDEDDTTIRPTRPTQGGPQQQQRKPPQEQGPIQIKNVPKGPLAQGFVRPATIGGPAGMGAPGVGSFSLPSAAAGLPPGEKIPSTVETASNAKNVYDKESLGYFYVNGKLQDTFLPSRFVNRNK